MSNLRTAYLKTERDAEMKKLIDRLLATDESGAIRPARMGPMGETRGLVVTGQAGEGKTTLIARALASHAALRTDGETLPVLHVDVPSPATVKSLAVQIVRASGYPVVSERKEGWFLWDLVRHRLHLREVRVLWLDEAHDTFRSGNEKDVLAITNTIKTLMKGDSGVSVILSGLHLLASFVRKDDQLTRRMSFLHLKSLDPDTDTLAVTDVLKAKADDVGLTLDLSRDLPGRLLASCDGRFGLIVETVTDACELALEEGIPTLDVTVFADALSDRMGLQPHQNHFLAADWRVLGSRFSEAETEGVSRGRRRGDAS